MRENRVDGDGREDNLGGGQGQSLWRNTREATWRPSPVCGGPALVSGR